MFEPNQSQLPLAEYLRPKFVGEIAGQKHILGEGKSLRVDIESGNLPSMILWGPPGVGKLLLLESSLIQLMQNLYLYLQCYLVLKIFEKL